MNKKATLLISFECLLVHVIARQRGVLKGSEKYFGLFLDREDFD